MKPEENEVRRQKEAVEKIEGLTSTWESVTSLFMTMSEFEGGFKYCDKIMYESYLLVWQNFKNIVFPQERKLEFLSMLLRVRGMFRGKNLSMKSEVHEAASLFKLPDIETLTEQLTSYRERYLETIKGSRCVTRKFQKFRAECSAAIALSKEWNDEHEFTLLMKIFA